MAIDATSLAKHVESLGFSGIFGVPDSLLAQLSAAFGNQRGIVNVTACNEGSAVGMAIGSFLATGRPGLVYLQNSGLGNTVNPILSLADRSVYGVPMVLLIGWRGQPGSLDEPQHLKQGQITESMLSTMGLPVFHLPKLDLEAKGVFNEAFQASLDTSGPVSVLVEKGTFLAARSNTSSISSEQSELLSREEAMKLVHSCIKPTDKLVATTGMLGREVEEHQLGMPPEETPGTFLNIGGMGHASSVALGLSLSKPGQRVWCFDGDGALLMHLGALPVIANQRPVDFLHIVFDNGAHDSVGGQATPLGQSNIANIALAAGYGFAEEASKAEEISEKLLRIKKLPGVRLLVIKIKSGSRDDLGRPSKTPAMQKNIFMESF
jgi:phosphonopyruvate decarboxylase